MALMGPVDAEIPEGRCINTLISFEVPADVAGVPLGDGTAFMEAGVVFMGTAFVSETELCFRGVELESPRNPSGPYQKRYRP